MRTEDRLRSDLESAYGRDLPGEEFDHRVMDALETDGAGGESEFCVPVSHRRRLPWGALLVAASVLLLVIGLFRLRSADEPVVAGPGDEPKETEIKISWKDLAPPLLVDADGFTFGGRTVKSDGLVAALVNWVGELRAAGKADPTVAIGAEAGLPWRHVHEAVLRLADPKVGVRRLQFVRVDPEKRAVNLMVPFDLRTDAGLHHLVEPGGKVPMLSLAELSRARGEGETRLIWCGHGYGRDLSGFAALRKRLATMNRESLPRAVEIKAWGPVPFGQVLSLIALLRTAGVEKLYLNGAAPEVLMIVVNLQPKDGRTVVYLDIENLAERPLWETVRSAHSEMFEMEDGLKELARRIQAAQKDGRKPQGLVSARTYVDQSAVQRVMKVFEDNGIKDVIRLN